MKKSANRNPAQESNSAPAPAHNNEPPIDRSPIYCAAQEVWSAFEQHLSGLLSAPVCVVSRHTLCDTAQNALLASAKQLGFGERAITFATLEADCANTQQNQPANTEVTPSNPPAEQESASSNTSQTPKNPPSTPHTLSSEQMFAIIEGIDPQVLIATDSNSMSVLSHTYATEFTANAPARLLGRTAVGFINFEKMLSNQTDKRTAWEHLKKLGTAPKAR